MYHFFKNYSESSRFGITEIVTSRRIDIRSLKSFASEKLPKDSVIRDILLFEKDVIDAHEFFGKMDDWLKKQYG